MEEGSRGHIGSGECPEWAMRKDGGITVGDVTGEVERSGRAKNMPTIGGEFGFLIISMIYQEEDHFEQGYQRVIPIRSLETPAK